MISHGAQELAVFLVDTSPLFSSSRNGRQGTHLPSTLQSMTRTYGFTCPKGLCYNRGLMERGRRVSSHPEHLVQVPLFDLDTAAQLPDGQTVFEPHQHRTAATIVA